MNKETMNDQIQYQKKTLSESEQVMYVIERDATENRSFASEIEDGWEVSRRSVLKGLAAGSFAVVILGNSPALALGQEKPDHTGGVQKQLTENINAWLRIEDDSTITALSPKVEYGQGIRMGFKMIVAEEMNIPVENVKMVMGDTARVEDDPTTGTWGSQSTITMYPYFRKAAALARETLLRLAAKHFDVSKDQLEMRGDAVGVKGKDGKEIAFSELVSGDIPASMVPSEPEYKSSSDYEHVGKDRKKNIVKKVTGERTFGSDVSVDGMVYGAVIRDNPEGQLEKFDEEKATSRDGVLDVVGTDSFRVVLAERTDIAREAIRDQVDGPWPGPEVKSEDVRKYLKENARGPDVDATKGNVKAGLEEADETIQVEYYLPYIQHSPIEPETATAKWEDGKLTVWTGTQTPLLVSRRLARQFNLSPDEIRVRVPDIGGAFGGKSNATVQEEAAVAAKQFGKPVQIQWTREEQFAFKYTRPSAIVEIQAGVKKDGTITAWDYHAIGQGTRATELPYKANSYRVSASRVPHLMSTGAWRGVSGPPNCWAMECAIDELAATIGADPAEFRMKNFKRSRSRKVMKKALDEFGWENAETGKNEGIGLAFGVDVGSEIAECIRMKVLNEDPPEVKVEHVTLSLDPGLVVNPEGIRLQCEGGVIMGLSSCLFEEMKFGDGTLDSTLFDSYKLAQFEDVPEVDTYTVDTGIDDPQGVGEPPIFPISPAIFNAYYNATGTRKRSMPLCK